MTLDLALPLQVGDLEHVCAAGEWVRLREGPLPLAPTLTLALTAILSLTLALAPTLILTLTPTLTPTLTVTRPEVVYPGSRVHCDLRRGTHPRSGLGLGLGLANPNANPNP